MIKYISTRQLPMEVKLRLIERYKRTGLVRWIQLEGSVNTRVCSVGNYLRGVIHESWHGIIFRKTLCRAASE